MRTITTTTPIATSARIQVKPVAIENAAPGLRTSVKVDEAAEQPDRLAGAQLATTMILVRMSTTSTSDRDRSEQPDLAVRGELTRRRSGGGPASGRSPPSIDRRLSLPGLPDHRASGDRRLVDGADPLLGRRPARARW